MMGVSKGIFNFKQKLSRSFAQVCDLLVPPTCLFCDAFVERQGGCCGSCWGKLKFISSPLCPVMGSPFSIDLGEGILSAEAIADPPPFTRLRASMLYDEMALKLVSQVKYSDRTDLTPWMARWMVTAGRELLLDVDVILPVPLHPARLRQRRFNQSAELGRHIAVISSLDFLPVSMIRRKHTRQQVGLTQSERLRNVSGAFIVPDDKKIDILAKRICLIDDVYTTGATTKAATRALLRAGAAQVDVLVFAKVETESV